MVEPLPVVAPEKLEHGDRAQLIQHAARSVKWSILYNTVPRFVTPFSTIILAALLTPADFGLVAISTFIIALARILVDLGLGKALIQRQTLINESASLSLWLGLIISASLYLLLWIAAPWFSVAYDDGRVTEVIRVSASSLLIYATMTVPQALLRRKMEFYRLFWVNSSLMIIQAVVSVALALSGLGVWAIILGNLVGMIFSSILAWSLVRWRPIFFMNWTLLRSMLGFSVWIMFASFQNWLILYADNAIAGFFLKVQGLGIYSLGFNFATLIPTFLVFSLSDVAYPVFCRLQESPKEVGLSLVRLQVLTATILFPLAFGLSAIAAPAIELLYKDKWMGLGMVISIMAILPGLSALWSLNENAYEAIGRPDIWTKLAGVSLLCLIPLLLISAPHGILPFVIARFLGAILLPAGNVFIGARILGISIKDQLKSLAFPFCCSIIMYILVLIIRLQFSPFVGLTGWGKLISTISIGAGIYLALIWLFNRELWYRLLRSLHRMLS
jgi:O-antigen/teichoic acid export membrane protein